MTTYRPWPTDPRYLVGDDGSVLGLRGQPLKLMPNVRWGYLYFSRRDLATGIEKRYRVNRVVCETFHGPAPSLRHQAAHRNGTRVDNRADNLCWATQNENESHKTQHGTAHRNGLALGHGRAGESNPAARLTEARVRELRKARADGASFGELAARLGVTPKCVRNAANGATWKHVR